MLFACKFRTNGHVPTELACPYNFGQLYRPSCSPQFDHSAHHQITSQNLIPYAAHARWHSSNIHLRHARRPRGLVDIGLDRIQIHQTFLAYVNPVAVHGQRKNVHDECRADAPGAPVAIAAVATRRLVTVAPLSACVASDN